MSNLDASYSVIVFNQLQEGADLESTREKLMSLLKVSAERVDALFAHERSVVKKDLDVGGAERYHSALHKTGIKVEIEEVPVEPSALSMEPLEEPTVEPASERTAFSEQVGIPEQVEASEKQLFCRHCGEGMGMSASTCDACGISQSVGKPKSQAVAAMLALLCGGLGVHRFYLGQWWGVFYLFLLPLSLMFSIGEAIVFACTTKKDWERHHGNVFAGMPKVAIIIAILFGVVFFGGILAAIAIPAYQDYTKRANTEH